MAVVLSAHELCWRENVKLVCLHNLHEFYRNSNRTSHCMIGCESVCNYMLHDCVGPVSGVDPRVVQDWLYIVLL